MTTHLDPSVFGLALRLRHEARDIARRCASGRCCIASSRRLVDDIAAAADDLAHEAAAETLRPRAAWPREDQSHSLHIRYEGSDTTLADRRSARMRKWSSELRATHHARLYGFGFEGRPIDRGVAGSRSSAKARRSGAGAPTHRRRTNRMPLAQPETTPILLPRRVARRVHPSGRCDCFGRTIEAPPSSIEPHQTIVVGAGLAARDDARASC